MRYYSTNKQSTPVNFRDALILGQAPDKGLYMPEGIPVLDMSEIRKFPGMDYSDIAFHVAWPFLQDVISAGALRKITRECYDFDIPLELVSERKYIVRLDQGPTASFKDFAARMMARLMHHFLLGEHRHLRILTATSGDTGSAVANAFYGFDNISVVILFPEKEVTDRQRRQMTTLGKNIRVISLDAKFDDCQALVKKAFADPDLHHLSLSSANSINIGRLVPQIVYYFYAYSRLADPGKDEQAIISVPSGNFGDMMGGVLARRMGLPVRKMIIATNANDEFSDYLQSGHYHKIEPSRNCISSAMNVGHPSNLARLVSLYGGWMDEHGQLLTGADMPSMRHELFGVSITDDETRDMIRSMYVQHGIILEPHGAVGWAGLMKYLENNPADDKAEQLCFSLETAHPAKFPDEIRRLTGVDPAVPVSLQGIDEKSEYCLTLKNDYQSFKEFLLTNKT